MDLARYDKLDIIVVCGLPGAGKSYFAKKYFETSGRKHINRNEIRAFLYTMTNFGRPWKNEYFDEEDEHLVKHTERKIIENILHHGGNLIVDNTSISKSSRKMYVDIAKETRKSIGVVYIDTPVKFCIQRNAKRSDPLPEQLITDLYVRAEQPQKEEGFQEVLTLSPH